MNIEQQRIICKDNISFAKLELGIPYNFKKVWL